jgi:hypothetical protein
MTAKEAVDHILSAFVSNFGCTAEGQASSEKTHAAIRALNEHLKLDIAGCPGHSMDGCNQEKFQPPLPIPNCEYCRDFKIRSVLERFTCPLCGSHEWATETGSQPWNGACRPPHGSRKCPFRWPRTDDALYFGHHYEICCCVTNRKLP